MESWKLLDHILPICGEKVLVCRDFDEIIDYNKVLEGRIRSSSQMKPSRFIISNFGLKDLGFKDISMHGEGIMDSLET